MGPLYGTEKKIWRGVGPGHPAEDSLTLRGLSSKPFSSLSTRLAHAARLGFWVLFTKTRYINSLLLLLLFLFRVLSSTR